MFTVVRPLDVAQASILRPVINPTVEDVVFWRLASEISVYVLFVQGTFTTAWPLELSWTP